MKISKKMNQIQKRENANDCFVTPVEICKKAVAMVDNKQEYVWLDPWKGTGNFYNNFPSENRKDWCEINEGRDFFEYNERVDVICSNPPFSKIDKCIDKCIELDPTYIIIVLGNLNMSPKRLQKINDKGYYLTKSHMFRVRNWFGNPYVFCFEKTTIDRQNLTFDRTEYKFIEYKKDEKKD